MRVLAISNYLLHIGYTFYVISSQKKHIKNLNRIIMCALQINLSDPERIRTPNPQSRNLIFYPVELRGL